MEKKKKFGEILNLWRNFKKWINFFYDNNSVIYVSKNHKDKFYPNQTKYFII